MDVVSIYTTTPSTAPPTSENPQTTTTGIGSSDKTEQYREVSRSSRSDLDFVLCLFTMYSMINNNPYG